MTDGVGMHDTGSPDIETRAAIEAILTVAVEPVPTQLLAQLVELPVPQVEDACRALAAAYEQEGRGFQVVRIAGGWRLQSHPDLAAYVERYILDGQSARMSAAALETLAIIAYKQPVSRAQVAAIRGVNVDGVIRTLQAREYITEIGRDPGPGNAVLFGTTPLFLERLGLDSLADLPSLTEFVPGADVVEALEAGLRLGPAPTAEEVEAAAARPASAVADEWLGLAEPEPEPEPASPAEPTAAPDA
jgi:segregation and condensation protein B